MRLKGMLPVCTFFLDIGFFNTNDSSDFFRIKFLSFLKSNTSEYTFEFSMFTFLLLLPTLVNSTQLILYFFASKFPAFIMIFPFVIRSSFKLYEPSFEFKIKSAFNFDLTLISSVEFAISSILP